MVFFFANRSEDSVDEAEAQQRALAGSATDLVGGGRLLIDARPWGEVTSVVDSEGESIELPPDRHTPLVLNLTPGRYTVFLTHPDLVDQPVPCEAEVSADVAVSCRSDLLPVTLKDYWEEVGWEH